MFWSPSVTTGTCPWRVTQGRAWPNLSPGRNSHRMATSPVRPSTRRASSVHGSRPAEPTFRQSVTRTVPARVT